LQALADSEDMPSGDTQSGGCGDMLEEFLADPGASVLGPFELVDPLVDRGIELCNGLLLLEHGLVAKLGGAWGPEILADARVEIPPACPKLDVGVAEIFGTLVELAELLSTRVSSAAHRTSHQGIRTRERLSTSSFLRTSNRAAC